MLCSTKCNKNKNKKNVQEPYASDDLQYDDNRVKLSSKVHFLSNTGDTKWTKQHLSAIPVNLNADSEKLRRLYARSAPSGGTASRRMGLDLRTRSTLYLPLKATVPPELVKLRKEVEEIIKSVQEDDEDFDEQELLKENALLQTKSSVTAAPPRGGDAVNSDHQHSHHHHHHQRHQSGEPAEAGGRVRHGAGAPAGKDGSLLPSLGNHPLAAKLQSIQVSPDR